MKIVLPKGATPIEANDMAGLLHDHVRNQGELNELEQANILQGLQWVFARKRDLVDISTLLRLHRELFGDVWDWAGSYRSTNLNIGVDKSLIATELYGLLNDIKFWVEHDTYTPYEIAARFHHRLVEIHPFPNGNGRFSRTAADALLKHHFKLPSFNWAKGHNLNVNGAIRDEYIAALREADNGGTYTPLFNYLGISEHSEL